MQGLNAIGKATIVVMLSTSPSMAQDVDLPEVREPVQVLCVHSFRVMDAIFRDSTTDDRLWLGDEAAPEPAVEQSTPETER
jgi:hypothetical protein